MKLRVAFAPKDRLLYRINLPAIRHALQAMRVEAVRVEFILARTIRQVAIDQHGGNADGMVTIDRDRMVGAEMMSLEAGQRLAPQRDIRIGLNIGGRLAPKVGIVLGNRLGKTRTA